MTASLIHDALYALMKAGLIHSFMRKRLDLVFLELCNREQIPTFLSFLMYKAIRIFFPIYDLISARKRGERYL
jgi:hypothetical protein